MTLPHPFEDWTCTPTITKVVAADRDNQTAGVVQKFFYRFTCMWSGLPCEARVALPLWLILGETPTANNSAAYGCFSDWTAMISWLWHYRYEMGVDTTYERLKTYVEQTARTGLSPDLKKAFTAQNYPTKLELYGGPLNVQDWHAHRPFYRNEAIMADVEYRLRLNGRVAAGHDRNGADADDPAAASQPTALLSVLRDVFAGDTTAVHDLRVVYHPKLNDWSIIPSADPTESAEYQLLIRAVGRVLPVAANRHRQNWPNRHKRSTAFLLSLPPFVAPVVTPVVQSAAVAARRTTPPPVSAAGTVSAAVLAAPPGYIDGLIWPVQGSVADEQRPQVPAPVKGPSVTRKRSTPDPTKPHRKRTNKVTSAPAVTSAAPIKSDSSPDPVAAYFPCAPDAVKLAPKPKAPRKRTSSVSLKNPVAVTSQVEGIPASV